MEGVVTFKYLGHTLDQTDDYWLAVSQNIMPARSVLGRLGTLLIREGVAPKVSEMFYRAVAQVVLLFGLEAGILLE